MSAVAVALSGLLIASPAHAADVDLVVNVSSDRHSYRAEETAVYTVKVTNRGGGDLTAAAQLSLQIPNTASSAVPWENHASCVSEGGAVCPSSFSRGGTSNDTLNAGIPAMPRGSSLTVTVQAPGNPVNFVLGVQAVTAAVTAGSVDTDTNPQTSIASTNVTIFDADVSYGTSVAAGSAVLGARETVTYDVELHNHGIGNFVMTELRLTTGAGTGGPANPAIAGATFRSASCIAASGGASCGDVFAAGFTSLIVPQPAELVSPGSTQTWIAAQLPAASSVTLRLEVFTGTPACTMEPEDRTRTISVRSEISALGSEGGLWETDLSLGADNSATVTSDVLAVPCSTGDISTLSLTQPSAQSTAGVAPAGGFEYTAEYTNLAGDPAIGADIEFNFIWPGSAGSTVNGNPGCVANGAAVCPDSWTVNGSSVRGAGADLPAGSSLVITYTGIAGGDDLGLCRPQAATVRSRILLPVGFNDTNYAANDVWTTGVQTQGNNARQITSSAQVGSSCLTSHDDAASQAGPYADPAATVPLSGPVTPGQVIYFRSGVENLAPGHDFTSWTISSNVQLPQTAFGVLSLSDEERWVRHQSGDPVGIPYRDDDTSFGQVTVPFDTGVRCEAAGGAQCPAELGSGGSSAGGSGMRWIQGWSSYWKSGQRPDLPLGSSLSFITPFKVPGYGYAGSSGCVPNGFTLGNSPTAATDDTANMSIQTHVTAATTPASADRSNLNDLVRVDVPFKIQRCSNTLEVTKTPLTSQIPADRLVGYDIVVTNTSGAALDLPRLIDTPFPAAPAVIGCTATTGGAVCPSFTPQSGVRYLADGTTGEIDIELEYVNGTSQFDFVWGAPGQPTMPAGSSVTFRVELQYPISRTAAVGNTVHFGADDSAGNGSWPMERASASLSANLGSALAVTKSIDPINPRPGAVVTFTIDIVNTGAALPQAVFTDTMHASLLATNPDGFGSVTCRPLEASDGALDTRLPTGSVDCPSFTSTAGGITGVIQNFAQNSGLRLSYTAVAPLSSASVPNVAALQHDTAAVTVGDSWSQVNLLTYATSVAGTVWNDANASAAGGFSGIQDGAEIGTDAGGLFVALIDDTTNEVIAVASVGPDGTYLFPSAPVFAPVRLVLTSTPPSVGDIGVLVTLPAGWVATSPLGQLAFDTGFDPVTGKDFGLQRVPETDDKFEPVQVNPGGDIRVPVPGLTGNDPEDGALGAGSTFVIVTLPIDGVLYYDGVPVTAGQMITGYDPAKLTVDPGPGAVTIVFTVAAVDSAGEVDPTPATVIMPFSDPAAASLTGYVWFDANRNGVRDPGEVGIADVEIILTGVDANGAEVSLTTRTDDAGVWSFPNLNPGRYTVSQTQPVGYATGVEVLGSGAHAPGRSETNRFFDIELVGGDVALGYGFGEILPVEDEGENTPPPVVDDEKEEVPLGPDGSNPDTLLPASADDPEQLRRSGSEAQTPLLAAALLALLAGATVLMLARRRRRA